MVKMVKVYVKIYSDIFVLVIVDYVIGGLVFEKVDNKDNGGDEVLKEDGLFVIVYLKE